MADQESASAEKAKRTVGILKLTGRNEDGAEPKTVGEAAYAVFAGCSLVAARRVAGAPVFTPLCGRSSRCRVLVHPNNSNNGRYAVVTAVI